MSEETKSIQTADGWKVTPEEVRDLCQEWKIPYPILKAAHQNLARGSSDVGIYEVLYVMGQAKMMGLPTLGNWFSVIPASEYQKSKGITAPSVCFKIDAALYILDHHPRVKPGTMEYYWIDGKGTRYESDNPPSFKKARDTDVLPQIDFDMTCTVSVELDNGKRVNRTLRYRDWVQNPDKNGSPWVKMPSHMIWKQTCKELVRMHFGGGIWEDEAHGQQMVDVTPPTLAERTQPKQIVATPKSVKEPFSHQELDRSIRFNEQYKEDQHERLNRLAVKMGIPEMTLFKGLEEYFLNDSGTVEDFLRDAEKSSAGAAPPDNNVKVVRFDKDKNIVSVSDVQPGDAVYVAPGEEGVTLAEKVAHDNKAASEPDPDPYADI